ncbi:MAG TPA: hypothetical protein VN048_09240 [Verrucomicrobiae bacterium]|jgi:hypothetical protein|nr:hypothetical protein [Verrucomicrobiae bacterium]
MSDEKPPPISWKTSISLYVIASPIGRLILGRHALTHLYNEAFRNPTPLAWALLINLGRPADPSFVWYCLDILLRIPESVFNDKWVKVANLTVDGLEGDSIREKLTMCRNVITRMFGLWNLPGVAAKLQLNYEGSK